MRNDPDLMEAIQGQPATLILPSTIYKAAILVSSEFRSGGQVPGLQEDLFSHQDVT